ncbi:MAG: TrkH family potassium uptake protein [Bacteroidales bacterium]|nr:TrkH family potassium uptake protein [Bacteroidales bacterium]MDD4002423.1 TrkH family potassium uptake protein [Bacteroidales bacterium]MDD4529128.1 TrkH family potassium uptake protein [Bacteroidales bacterium]MDD4829771.1 TrkH family potassium uptake protein [Bacteroidales bacterium]
MYKQRLITLSRVLGMLLMLESVFMLLCLLVAYIYNESNIFSLFLSASITLFVGILLRFPLYKRQKLKIDRKLGFLIVASIWIVMSIFGSLPYYLGNYIPSFSDSFFECISGFTTTSATIIPDLNKLPNSILFWRSLTNWIGGIGIVVIVLSFIPFIGGGGMSLFTAEVAGPSKNKLSPRTKETALIIIKIYLGLTILTTISFFAAGMSWFDAINHGLSTISSGGFSTQNDSVSQFSPLIQYVIIIFMIISGISFPLIYFAIKRNFKRLWLNEEFKVYISIILIATIVVGLIIYDPASNLESNFRHSLFQVSSILSSAGFISYDYTLWSAPATFLLFLLMFSGAMAGSTTGGLKLVRVILLFKNARNILQRATHSHAYIPIKFEKKTIEQQVINNVLTIFLLYLFTFVIASVLLVALGLGFFESMGGVVSCLSNMGAGFGEIGAYGNYAQLSQPAKWIFASLMYLGRLELITVFCLFMPAFWKN